MATEVKAKRLAEGQYELRLGDHVIVATRQPDLYFKIHLGGTDHKGYLYDLKKKFQAHVQGGAVAGPTPAARPKEAAVASGGAVQFPAPVDAAALLADLVAGRHTRLTEWERDFIDRLVANKGPRGEWQLSQLKVLYRTVGGYPEKK
jgi:hypothetical protein